MRTCARFIITSALVLTLAALSVAPAAATIECTGAGGESCQVCCSRESQACFDACSSVFDFFCNQGCVLVNIQCTRQCLALAPAPPKPGVSGDTSKVGRPGLSSFWE